LVPGALRRELPGDRLEQVPQSDDAQHFAVFVDHEGELHVGGAEILQQLQPGIGKHDVAARHHEGADLAVGQRKNRNFLPLLATKTWRPRLITG